MGINHRVYDIPESKNLRVEVLVRPDHPAGEDREELLKLIRKSSTFDDLYEFLRLEGDESENFSFIIRPKKKSFLSKVKKKIKSIGISFALGMAKADMIMTKNTGQKIPEDNGVFSRNYSDNDALRAIQLGKLTEQQLKEHHKMLNSLDTTHGRTEIRKIADGYYDEAGEWVDPEYEAVLIEHDSLNKAKQSLGDVEEGYETVLFLANKQIQLEEVHIDSVKLFKNDLTGKDLDEALGDLIKWENTLAVTRTDERWGTPKIEDYTHEIFVKRKIGQDEEDDTCLVEFYCLNFNKKKAEEYSKDGLIDFVPEDAYSIITNPFNLPYFTDFTSFTVKESTATRNNLLHEFIDVKFDKIKRLQKGFVVKFHCKKK